MAASSLSIAAATTTTSNSLLFNSRNLPFERSLIPIPPPKHKLFTLKIKPHFSFSSPFTCFSSSSSSSVNLEFSQTTETSQETEDEEEEQEFDDYEEEEDDDDDRDDKIVSHSAEAGRLYVGNLPYAMTSSQLADIFAEAGPVISVEVCFAVSLKFRFF